MKILNKKQIKRQRSTKKKALSQKKQNTLSPQYAEKAHK